MTSLTGRRMAPHGKIHLLKSQERDKSWLTVCGRKIRPDYALAAEHFSFNADDCCSCCSYKHKLSAA